MLRKVSGDPAQAFHLREGSLAPFPHPPPAHHSGPVQDLRHEWEKTQCERTSQTSQQMWEQMFIMTGQGEQNKKQVPATEEKGLTRPQGSWRLLREGRLEVSGVCG